jgi:hypothetical protein
MSSQPLSWVRVDDHLTEKFRQKCRNKNEKPRTVLSRMIKTYIDQDNESDQVDEIKNKIDEYKKAIPILEGQLKYLESRIDEKQKSIISAIDEEVKQLLNMTNPSFSGVRQSYSEKSLMIQINKIAEKYKQPFQKILEIYKSNAVNVINDLQTMEKTLYLLQTIQEKANANGDDING